MHYEVEVLIKINKVGKHIAARFADKYYDEVGLGIDFTARDVQAHCKERKDCHGKKPKPLMGVLS